MAVLEALRQTPRTLARNPVLFVPTFLLTLFQVPQLLLQTVDPLVAGLVSTVVSLAMLLVMPFFQGGIVGMADEALDGRTSLDGFVRAGTANYVPMLVAYLGVVAVNVALGVVAVIVGVVGGVAFLHGPEGGAGLAVLAVVGLVAVLLVLAYLLVTFFVQFYGQAIVLGDRDAVDGLGHSVGVVRDNLASTLGYSLVVGVLGGVAGVAFAAASMLVSPAARTPVALPHLSTAGAVGVALLVAVVGSLFGGFFGVYSVAFYRIVDPGVDDAGR